MTSVLIAILIDTNILVYMLDSRDPIKQAVANRIYSELTALHQAVLSVQCLSEFFNSATRRLPVPMTPVQAQVEVQRFARECTVLPLTEAAVQEAVRGVVQHQLALWDALIWSVARQHGIPYILTEDAPDGRVLEGVTYRNPFLPGFRLPAV